MTRPALAFCALFAATMAFYAAIVLWSLPRISGAAGGLAPFDLRPAGYDLAQATAFLDALTPAARAQYLGAQHWLDTVYPPLLALTLGWAILWGFRDAPAVLRLGLLVPAVAGAGFDLLENARVAALLRADDVTAGMVARASFATVAKSVATALAMLAALAGLARRIRIARRRRA